MSTYYYAITTLFRLNAVTFHPYKLSLSQSVVSEKKTFILIKILTLC